MRLYLRLLLITELLMYDTLTYGFTLNLLCFSWLNPATDPTSVCLTMIPLLSNLGPLSSSGIDFINYLDPANKLACVTDISNLAGCVTNLGLTL